MKNILLVLVLLPSIVFAQKISDLPAASTLGGTEQGAFLQSGTAKKTSVNQIAAYVQSLLTGVYQPVLVSGTSIKTVNGVSLLGSGNISTTQDLSGLVVKTNNLSDLANAGTARTNLGLGSLATQSGTYSEVSGDGKIITGLVTGGIVDNLAAVNSALATATGGQRLIIPEGSYLFSGPIDLTSYTKNIILEVRGDLYFASGVNGIVTGGNTTVNTYLRKDVYVYGTLYGANSGTTYGSFTDGVGLLIKNAVNGNYYLSSASLWKTAIQLEASGSTSTGSFHNHIQFGILEQNANGIIITATGNTANFVNQNYFVGGNISGGAGIKFTKNTSQADPFNGNTFTGCSVEPVTGICWDVDFAQGNIWFSGRSTVAENPASTNRFKFSSTASYNKVIGYTLNSTDITDAGSFNDFSQSRIVDNTNGEEMGMYYDWANRRLALGRSDQFHYPYFLPQSTLDVRGGVLQIRKDLDYGYTGTDTYQYMAGGNVVSDNGTEKGYAFRIQYTGPDTPSKFLLSAYTANDPTNRFAVPTSFTDILTISNGTLGIRAGTTASAPLNVAAGVAPSSPVSADIWGTSLGLFYRANTTTQQLAPLASPAFTGTPSLPTGTTGITQTAGNSTTALATTAFVTTADNLKAPLASPTFTGTPAAPTATAGTTTTQIATTAFVRTPAVQAVTSSATVTPTFSNDMVAITAQAVGLTLANPTGTAQQGQLMRIRIKDNGSAQTIAYGTQYRAIGVTLPTTTTINKTMYLFMSYNSTDTKWDVVDYKIEP